MLRKRIFPTLAVLYAVGVFVTSDDAALRVMSMTACNVISIVMAALLVLESAATRRIARDGNPLLIPLLLTAVATTVSLAASRLNPLTNIAAEVSSYAWTQGLNSPGLRGPAFLVRFLLSCAAFHFIFRTASDAAVFARIVKAYSWAYTAFCTITLSQLVAYHVFGVQLGELFFTAGGGVRIGSYVGEPSVLAGILASGYFLVFPSRNVPQSWPRLPAPVRWYAFIAATIGLAYTMSASFIAGLVLAYLLTGPQRKRKLITAALFVAVLLGAQPLYNLSLDNALLSKIYNELTTVNIRTLSWLVGWNMWKASPLTGVGIGQSPFFNARFLPIDVVIPFDVRLYYDYTAMRHPPMNTYIEWASETGAFGMAALTAVAAAALRFQRSFRADASALVRRTFGMSVIAILIAANSFPDAFYLSHLIFVLAMYFAGLVAFEAHPAPASSAERVLLAA